MLGLKYRNKVKVQHACRQRQRMTACNNHNMRKPFNIYSIWGSACNYCCMISPLLLYTNALVSGIANCSPCTPGNPLQPLSTREECQFLCQHMPLRQNETCANMCVHAIHTVSNKMNGTKVPNPWCISGACKHESLKVYMLMK